MDKEKMYIELKNTLNEEQILRDEPMSKHTTFRIGGKADFVIMAKNEKDIVFTYKYAKKNNIPFYITGKASNILVKDNGVRGIVLKNLYDSIKIINEEDGYTELEVASGTPLAKLANFALENELEGLEFCYGIPGTVGGAVRMNAGAYGGEIKEFVTESIVLDREGEKKTLNFAAHKFAYRNSRIAEEGYTVLSTKFKLKKGNKESIQYKMDTNMNARREKQPYDMPSAGSVFKRGNGFITSILIDEAGLKGTRIGGAMVSEKHAGFIVNTGDATAQDVLDLIEHIKNTVKEKFDEELEQEVLVIGE